MKTEKISLVFWNWEWHGKRVGLNHRSNDIKKFVVWDSDDYSYWILEEWTENARYKVYYDKDCPREEYMYNFEGEEDEWCFYILSQRLQAINSAKHPGYSISFEAYDAPENPILNYRYIDDDHWILKVFYPDPDVPWAEWVKPIEAVISKKDLFEAFYVWFIKQIIKYYDWIEWVFDNGGYSWSKESNLYTFFSRDIDRYLRDHWVKDISKLVQKAKDKIKSDLWRVYEEWDKFYNTPKYSDYSL